MVERIQLKRTKGWRMPANTVKVDRTTKWGNPFAVIPMKLDGSNGLAWSGFYVAGIDGFFDDAVDAAAASIAKFRRSIEHPANRTALGNLRVELRGKNLACWCKPGAPCHADVLLELANA